MPSSFLVLVPMIAAFLPACAGAPSPLRIHGLVAAVLTPFDEAGRLNLTVVPTQHAYLRATDVEYVFVTGTTGESLSLSREERMAVMDAWIDAGARVIMHVGAESVNDARALATHAQSRGALAIGAMPPTFFKPANVDALAATIAAICTGAPALPCYYYHIPSMTGTAFPMIDVVPALEARAPNFAGIKYTGFYTYPGLLDAQRVIEYKGGKYEVLSGREEQMIEAMAVGMVGHVGSQFNIAGDLYAELARRFAAEGITPSNGAALRRMQSRAQELISAWQRAQPAGVNGYKEFLNLAGVPVGPSRLPSLPVDDAARAALRAAFVEFCGRDADTRAMRMCSAHREHSAAVLPRGGVQVES